MTCAQLEPTGTMWDMSPERRPRIPDDLADRIDRTRGGIPFERWVREALDAALPPEHFTPTVENYLSVLREDIAVGQAIDQVGTHDEWETFKEALSLWVQEQDLEWIGEEER